MIKIKPFIISLLIPLAAGGLAAFLTRDSMDIYELITRPPLSPPGWLFPVVWTLLYLLMGVSAYMVWASCSPGRETGLILYGVQLAVNFLWPILFFSVRAWLFSALWLTVLWILVIAMILAFRRVKPAAARLQIPYLLWVTFAGYLNYGIYLLNR